MQFSMKTFGKIGKKLQIFHVQKNKSDFLPIYVSSEKTPNISGKGE
jgi:hypothetical protein